MMMPSSTSSDMDPSPDDLPPPPQAKDGGDNGMSCFLAEEDKALFGNLSGTLADTLSNLLKVALADGVTTLPLLGGEEQSQQSEALFSQLRARYDRNVDLLELYCARNVFSIGMYPPKRRQAILHAYLEGKEGDGGDRDGDVPISDAENAEDDGDTEENDALMAIQNSKTAIPTAAQVETIEEELRMLRAKLDEMHLRKKSASREVQQLRVAHQLAQEARGKAAVAGGDASATTTKAVAAAVDGLETLEQLQAHGQDLLQDMEEAKRLKQQHQRSSQSSGDDGGFESDYEQEAVDEGFVVVMPHSGPQSRRADGAQHLDLHQRYERDRQALAGGSVGTTSATGLEKVYKMLTSINKENAAQRPE